MIKEEGIIKILTDKLVKVAKWPNMRKEFAVAVPMSATISQTVFFYKNDPKMSNIEYVTLIYCYVNELTRKKNDDEVQAIIDRCFELLEQIEDYCDFVRVALHLYRTLYDYYSERGNEEQAYECHKRWLFYLTESFEGASEDILNEYLTILEQRNDKQQLLDVVNDCKKYIEEKKKKLEEDEDWDAYAQSVYEYICSKEELIDEEDYFVLTSIMQINEIIELPQRTRIKKGSFDYNYAKAEKGDKEYQLLVAKAYREGDGVPQNIRLANLWEGFANNKIVE